MLLDTPFSKAVIVVLPVPALVAFPPAPITATFTFDDFHVAWLDRLIVLPSLNFPVAVNCCELPSAMLAAPGEIVMEVSVAFVTCSDAVPTTPAKTAVTVAVPAATPVARPFVPPVSPTVATDAGDDVHVAAFVRFCVLPSRNVPMALNCVLICAGIVAVAGVMAIEFNAVASTIKFAELLIPPSCAVIVTAPADCPVAPPEPVMLATVASEVLHPTTPEIFCVVPSLYVPMAE